MTTVWYISILVILAVIVLVVRWLRNLALEYLVNIAERIYVAKSYSALSALHLELVDKKYYNHWSNVVRNYHYRLLKQVNQKMRSINARTCSCGCVRCDHE